MSGARRQSNDTLETRLNSLETAGRFAVHNLAVNLSGTNNDVASLRFNNLVIGRTYRVIIQMSLTGTNNADGTIVAVHNGNTIAETQWVYNGGGTEDINPTLSTSTIFVATANTLIFNSSGNGTINAGSTNTFAVLEELPFVTQTSAFD